MNYSLLFKNQRYRNIFFILFVFFSILYFIFKNHKAALSILNFSLFSPLQKTKLFLTSLFNMESFKDPLMLILVLLFVFSISVFFTLAIALYRNSKELSKGKSVWSTIFIFISILGLSCASCGVGLLASILSLFGASYLISYFPLHGLELGFLGIVFLFISNYFLLKRVKSPFTC